MASTVDHPVPTPRSTAASFADALVSPGPAAELGDAADLYGWLVGRWQARVVDYEEDGARHEQRGEWHFAWVLAGRAVQDVWISPPPAEQGTGAPGRVRYGTTLRRYDPAAGVWRITWYNPVSGAEVHLVARRVGDRIVQEGRADDETLLRWSFVDITPDSFTWRGEVSADGGRSWYVDAEFFCTRADG
jgi:hypothetical protein